jgi:hypothetical protein
MVGLPLPQSIVRLKAFWLSVTILVSCIMGAMMAGPFSAGWFLRIGVIFLVLLLPGWSSQKLMMWSYNRWNKIVVNLARLGRGWIILIVMTIITLVGKFGSKLMLSADDSIKSLWVEVKTGRGQKTGHRIERISTYRWLSNYIRWCRSSGNGWAVFLLPYLFLLSKIETARYKPSIPKNTYTLY